MESGDKCDFLSCRLKGGVPNLKATHSFLWNKGLFGKSRDSVLKGCDPDQLSRFRNCLVLRLIIYKQQFLHSDWLRVCQLIPNQCKKVKLRAKRWNWVQKKEIEKTVKLKWLTAPTLSSDKQNGREKLNKDWNSLSKFQYNYLNKAKCKAQQQ